MENLHEAGNFFCWGNDKSILLLYSEILKKYEELKKITFKNLITWYKGSGHGQRNSLHTKFVIADEKCLFFVNGLYDSLKSDDFPIIFENLRNYIRMEFKKLREQNNLSSQNIADYLCVDTSLVGHFISKSQWQFIQKKYYEKLQKLNKNCFLKEYEELKKEYKDTKPYFNNTHDNFNNVWHLNRDSTVSKYRNYIQQLRAAHPTPKPIELCDRIIKSCSKENDIVLDLFLGSGSTLLSCETNKRRCFGLEISPKFCQIIIDIWQYITQKKAVLLYDI